MGVTENVDLVVRFYQEGPADDDGAGRAQFALPDIVWHVPGDNPVSGRYQGHDEVFTTIGARMQPLERWTMKVRTVTGNDDLVVARVDLEAIRGSHHVACEAAHVFRFGPDGRIAEVWGFVDDQDGLDALFSS